MFALGLQGSPRKKGNSETLLAMFMAALERQGVRTRTLAVCQMNVKPCIELLVCEKKGYCPIDDDMAREVYGLLRRADLVVAASPVFFYNVSAQLKALIDRCQLFWARKYLLKLKDPGAHRRQGFMLAVGASGGKQLFDGLHLTARYFFDAIDARYAGHLTYRKVEKRGAIRKLPGIEEDVDRAVAGLMNDLHKRRKIVIVGQTGACRSQMAAGFAARAAGQDVAVMCAGIAPAEHIDPQAVAAMRETGIDLEHQIPCSLEAALGLETPDDIITFSGVQLPENWTGIPRVTWDLPMPAKSAMEEEHPRDRIDQVIAEWQDLRDRIEEHVNAFFARQ